MSKRDVIAKGCAMSDAPRCEPPEEYRGRDGWWWVLRRNSLDQEPRRWHAAERAWEIDDGLTDFAGAVCGYSTLTPAEVAALRAERDAALARVAVLEGTLRRISAGGYAIPPDATDAQLALYWALQTRRCKELARAALSPTPAVTPASALRDGDHPV